MTKTPSLFEIDDHGAPRLSIDWEDFAHHLQDSDLSDEQKREFIETLFEIMLAFVDLGFGLHPVQQACEQNRDSPLSLPVDLLSSFHSDNRSDQAAPDTPCLLAEKEES